MPSPRAIHAVLIGLLLAAAPAPAQRPTVWHGQRPIQWSAQPRQAVARAHQLDRPVLFYISGSRNDDNDLEDNQRQAFRHPLVRSIAEERFVPVRLPRSPQSYALLQKTGAAPPFELSLHVVTAEGRFIGSIDASTAGNVWRLSEALTNLYRAYRVQYFTDYLEPLFDAEAAATDGELRNALRMIRKLTLLEADLAVVSLAERGGPAERGGLSDALRAETARTLAALSTPASVRALVKMVAHEPKLQPMLADCTRGAAEYLLPFLDAGEPEYRIAYEAAVRICRVPRPRPARFFENAERGRIDEELWRVRDHVRDCATEWNSTYGLYR